MMALPSPWGNLPAAFSIIKYVENLLFNLFKFVFHHDYNSLNFYVVCLRAKGVDFSADFLGYEAEFFSGSNLVMISSKWSQ